MEKKQVNKDNEEIAVFFNDSPQPETAPESEAKKTPQKRPQKIKKISKRKKLILKIIRRTLIAILVLIIFIVFSVYSLCYTLVNGPSPTAKNMAVLNALQASATKWVPGLFLSDEEVSRILSDSKIVTIDEINIDDYTSQALPVNGDGEVIDEWADCPDGIQYKTVNGSTYKAYVLIIKDPSKVYVATSSNFIDATRGKGIFDIVKQENAIAAINGGEFSDVNGKGTGATPMGLTYSCGKVVWNDNLRRTFIGFDSNNKLIVSESMTEENATSLGIRDAVCFQNGNVLIDLEDGVVSLHYNDHNNGTAQRTAIGQRADGAVIFLVTDGRTTSSLGATHNDIIDLMVSFGAVSAAMLDGGSSAMMYYKDYAKKYGIDESLLDDYQKQGMVNKYKAFTPPRWIPTYFAVRSD